MLSRRNVRIKILQQLYLRDNSEDHTGAMVVAGYRKALDQSYELYLFALYALIRISEVSREDLANRAQKHLPTLEDKAFQPRLYENELIQSLESNADLQERFNQLKFKSSVDSDIFRRLYKTYSKEANYIQYAGGSNEISDQEILLDLFRLIRKHELFEELMEEKYYSWVDDESLVIGAIKKTIKKLPTSEAFYKEFIPDTETTEEFGMKLLNCVLDNEHDMVQTIKPKLNNWDIDRIAKIDIILLKMALAELTEFPTIPPKATINEYVEIAKLYSTDKSKEFVNGILDTMLKELDKDGKIIKRGPGLK